MIINILVNGNMLVIIMVGGQFVGNRRIGILVNRIGGGQFVGGVNILVNGCTGFGSAGLGIGESHFIEPVTLPFTTVHSSLNVPSPVTGACSLVVPCSVISLVVLAIFEWNLIVLRPSK